MAEVDEVGDALKKLPIGAVILSTCHDRVIKVSVIAGAHYHNFASKQLIVAVCLLAAAYGSIDEDSDAAEYLMFETTVISGCVCDDSVCTCRRIRLRWMMMAMLWRTPCSRP